MIAYHLLKCQNCNTGTNCEIIPDKCLNNLCASNGTCVPDADPSCGYGCQCAVGFTGKFCETPIDPCNAAVCYNSGTCVKNATLK